MRDYDMSLNFNGSRFNSTGWQNFHNDDISQEMSLLSRNANNYSNLQPAQSYMISEPPRPALNISNYIESQSDQYRSIRQVDYAKNQPEAKKVNSKQYYRMMKMRIKKVMNQFSNSKEPMEKPKKRGYIYESRHKHALGRVRGKDGKFLATRPESERCRQKKKRGRKPKNYKQQIEEPQADTVKFQADP